MNHNWDNENVELVEIFSSACPSKNRRTMEGRRKMMTSDSVGWNGDVDWKGRGVSRDHCLPTEKVENHLS